MAERARGDHARYFDGVSRMIRAAGRRVADSDPEDLVELVALQAALDAALAAAVEGQRDRYSLAQIARGLGVSKQAVAQRWGQGANLSKSA